MLIECLECVGHPVRRIFLLLEVRLTRLQLRALDEMKIVHVAGTKGKGTTCAFVDSILAAYRQVTGSDIRVGLYTSPHLFFVCVLP